MVQAAMSYIRPHLWTISNRLMRQSILAKAMLCVMVFIGVAYGSGAALSAARTPSDDLVLSVNTRTNPAYDPQGIRIHDLTLYPTITTGIGYSDNIYAQGTNEEEDFIYTIKSGLALKSDFIRHALQASINAERGIYDKNSSENYTDYKAALSGQIDVTGQTAIPLSFSYEREHYDRDTPDDVIGRDPTEYSLWTGTMGLIHKGRRFVMKAIATMRSYIFDDNTNAVGVAIDNSTRDRKEWSLYTSIGLPEEGYFAPFVYSDLIKVDYDSATDTSGFNRDSAGYEVGVGTIVNISEVTKASFNVGHVTRNADDPNLEDISDVTYGMNIVWEPSTLAAFTLSGKRTVEETVQPGSQGSLRDNITLRMNYELYPNFFLAPMVDYEQRDYEGVDREIERVTGGVDMTYKMNQNLWLSGAYRYITQEEKGSRLVQDDFESNNFNLSLKLQF